MEDKKLYFSTDSITICDEVKGFAKEHMLNKKILNSAYGLTVTKEELEHDTDSITIWEEVENSIKELMLDKAISETMSLYKPKIISKKELKNDESGE